MKWEEFCSLLTGLGPNTPLGRIVGIRSEDDKEMLKHFNTDQLRIRSEWQRRQAKTITPEQRDQVLESLKQAFISLAGGGNNH